MLVMIYGTGKSLPIVLYNTNNETHWIPEPHAGRSKSRITDQLIILEYFIYMADIKNKLKNLKNISLCSTINNIQSYITVIENKNQYLIWKER